MLSNIEPPHIRHDRATLQEYKKAQQLTDGVPIEQVLREPPKSRLRPRRPFVFEAARLVSLNQTEQEIWEQSWIQWVPPGHDLVTNPTCPQPGFTLPRRQFVTLNRLRCGQARCAESLYRWGVIASPSFPCGESHHIPQGTLLKSANSLHSLEACDGYTKRILTQWNGYQNCRWNYESVSNEQQQRLSQAIIRVLICSWVHWCKLGLRELPKVQKRTTPSVGIEPTTPESWVQHPNQ